MRIHIILHASFEQPGVIETWALSRKHTISSTHTYRGELLPDPSQIDFLVIMGGPQSPLEADQYPYLRDEILLTKTIIQQKKPVLGICLGAQIIGESFGAKTEKSPDKEVGVFPIQLTEAGKNDFIFKNFPGSFDVMHWHNDMPGITDKCEILAFSEGCPRQIIRYADHVYGLQCHLELTPELVNTMALHCPADFKPENIFKPQKNSVGHRQSMKNDADTGMNWQVSNEAF